MDRRFFLLTGAASLAACTKPETVVPLPDAGARASGTGGSIYKIPAGREVELQFRMLDSLNTLRGLSKLPPLTLSARLNAAAATHSLDMFRQNRPWHFGSDGSSPLDRANRVGYQGVVLGEVISETFENELQTLTAWMQKTDTRAILTDRNAREMGFAWYQQDNGKIWWTLVTGRPKTFAERNG